MKNAIFAALIAILAVASPALAAEGNLTINGDIIAAPLVITEEAPLEFTLEINGNSTLIVGNNAQDDIAPKAISAYNVASGEELTVTPGCFKITGTPGQDTLINMDAMSFGPLGSSISITNGGLTTTMATHSGSDHGMDLQVTTGACDPSFTTGSVVATDSTSNAIPFTLVAADNYINWRLNSAVLVSFQNVAATGSNRLTGTATVGVDYVLP